ncbi:MAG: hypothetical protein IIB75_02010 [Proteobacteria bacterium]|nr:hypothetical protein [Pseudomonadota bacterium]
MPTPTGISRRLEQCVQHLQARDYEGSLVNLFPAIDKTAKKRRPKHGVARRIKTFLEEEEALISVVATGNIITNMSVNGIKITDALYKFGRTPIAHEGELDPRLQFNASGSIEIGAERWNLPAGYIVGMCVAVVVATENTDEQVSDSLEITLGGQSFKVNELWGQKILVQGIFCNKFDDKNLFGGTGA